MDLSEDWQDVFEDIGEPYVTDALSDKEIESIESILPDDLIDYFRLYGRSVLFEGRIQICHPIDLSGMLALVFKADTDFNHKLCHAYAYSSFGEIFFWHQEYGYSRLLLLDGEIYCSGLTKEEEKEVGFHKTFITAFSSRKDRYELYDLDDKPLFSRVRKKLGEVSIGECYGFVPALGLGGVPELEKLKKLKAPEHFAILAQLIDFQFIDVQGYGQSVVVREIG
ncbi:T6SS immunity protein Tdi1 domain-containing protein [Pseudovibrio sp. JE062]|uniref:T6SS immunity protein Tdi1 domain-containing protein n=1 Tax=Pseudovibrio sp. JE062 TaxID=439495 RepID=UPI000186BCBF|nr:T6SS immunity protein Tdi1 domain-containing protein [Pseudovibrio sp. JE062]EEA94927.1 conserved domain protein [Pseudovibrio sp. JE062]